jgi:hypothetical protein
LWRLASCVLADVTGALSPAGPHLHKRVVALLVHRVKQQPHGALGALWKQQRLGNSRLARSDHEPLQHLHEPLLACMHGEGADMTEKPSFLCTARFLLAFLHSRARSARCLSLCKFVEPIPVWFKLGGNAMYRVAVAMQLTDTTTAAHWDHRPLAPLQHDSHLHSDTATATCNGLNTCKDMSFCPEILTLCFKPIIDYFVCLTVLICARGWLLAG